MCAKLYDTGTGLNQFCKLDRVLRSLLILICFIKNKNKNNIHTPVGHMLLSFMGVMPLEPLNPVEQRSSS
jgi:hypothetical protein